MDLDGIVAEIWDPQNDVSDSRRYWLNQVVAASDSWIAPAEWKAVADATRSLHDNDMVTLGFDGSVRDDSTALVACRVEDGHLELLGCWEKPDGPGGDTGRSIGWRSTPRCSGRSTGSRLSGSTRTRRTTRTTWTSGWRSSAARCRVRATAQRPLEWWTTRPKPMVDALERFHEAVVSRHADP